MTQNTLFVLGWRNTRTQAIGYGERQCGLDETVDQCLTANKVATHICHVPIPVRYLESVSGDIDASDIEYCLTHIFKNHKRLIKARSSKIQTS